MGDPHSKGPAQLRLSKHSSADYALIVFRVSQTCACTFPTNFCCSKEMLNYNGIVVSLWRLLLENDMLTLGHSPRTSLNEPNCGEMHVELINRGPAGGQQTPMVQQHRLRSTSLPGDGQRESAAWHRTPLVKTGRPRPHYSMPTHTLRNRRSHSPKQK